MKVGANWAELVQLMHKFVPPSYVGMLRNEHTRSTPLDFELMFWGVSDYFVTA
jgi:hypothetical protein